jgi:hypothetical protein
VDGGGTKANSSHEDTKFLAGGYNALPAFIRNMADRQLLRPANRDLLPVDDDISRLLEKMRHYIAPQIPKWFVK